jgi:mRNA interferase RelE/StbE
MERYRLVFRKSVARDLRGLPEKDVARILRRIEALAESPRPPGSEKLAGLERYRLRVGTYRVLYEIEDNIITVIIVKIAHRKDAYRG